MQDAARFRLVAGEREYGDAPTLADALYGAATIAKEDGIEVAVLRPDGMAVGWGKPDGTNVVLQGAQR